MTCNIHSTFLSIFDKYYSLTEKKLFSPVLYAMKKHITLAVFLLMFLCAGFVQAQSVYEARFGNPQVNCSDGTFCTTLQLKGEAGQPEFAIGSHTLFFNYNKNLINSPVYQTIHFNHLDSCALGGFFAPYFSPSNSYDPATGEFNLTTNMILTNAGCPVITDAEWVDVGTVCFQIINGGLTTQLSFNATLTLLNLNDNTPQHIQGTLFGLDMLIDCPIVVDTDGDGLTDDEELSIGTEILIPDTDSDGLLDGDEVNIFGTNPLLADTDGDGLNDGEEMNVYGTNPLIADTDGDGLLDGEEIEGYGTNPLMEDTDGDGLNDGEEVTVAGSNPLVIDTDGDGLLDGEEVTVYGTNPVNGDTDGDDLNDGDELNIYGTNPLLEDTDSDGLSDGEEVLIYNTNPLLEDGDNDGLTDGNEVDIYTTNPLLPDTDGDGMSDGDEVNIHGTDPLVYNDFPGIFSPASDKVAVISVFPNPVKSQLNVLIPEMIQGKTIEVVILQSNGEQVWKQIKEGEGLLQLPLQALPPGAYILQVLSDKTLFGAAKFVKQ